MTKSNKKYKGIIITGYFTIISALIGLAGIFLNHMLNYKKIEQENIKKTNSSSSSNDKKNSTIKSVSITLGSVTIKHKGIPIITNININGVNIGQTDINGEIFFPYELKDDYSIYDMAEISFTLEGNHKKAWINIYNSQTLNY